jgi:hypothetical protein
MYYEEKFIQEIPKTYENVYNSRMVLSWCRLERMSNDIGVDEKEYRKMMYNMFEKEQLSRFDFLVKYYWLSQKFVYFGRLRSKFSGNSYILDRAFGTYMKCHVGFNNRLISGINTKLFSYIDDFFPNLMAENPFKKKMKYPYKYMKFECLILVADIPERLDLLNYGEKKRMGFSQFADFIYNYVCTINEKMDETIFDLNFSFPTSNPYVRYHKSNKIKTSDIRQGKQQLPPTEFISTKPLTKGNGNNS